MRVQIFTAAQVGLRAAAFCPFPLQSGRRYPPPRYRGSNQLPEECGNHLRQVKHHSSRRISIYVVDLSSGLLSEFQGAAPFTQTKSWWTKLGV